MPPMTGTNYYVDSVAGNDTNSGLNEQCPLQSLTNATITNLVGPGVTINIKRGSVFGQQVVLTNYGLTIVAYGMGPKPLISGGDVLTNSLFTLAPSCSYTYQIPFGPFAYTNIFARILNTNVPMVWDNKARLGFPPFESGIITLSQVDATPGSFLYTNGYVYVHPADNSNPATNGRLYEATTRTICFVGGDNCFVQDLRTEESYCYPYSSVGQCGWGFDAQGGGTYNRCESYRFWIHAIGTTSGFNDTMPLIFENCFGYDGEQGPYSSTATFIAYKGGLPIGVSNEIVFTNCLAQQPSLYPGGKTEAFFAHGVPDTNEWVEVLNCSAVNCDTVITIGNQCFQEINGLSASNMQVGVNISSNGQFSINISNVFLTGATSYALLVEYVTNTSVSFVNCTNLNSAVGAEVVASVGIVEFSNCLFSQRVNGGTAVESYEGSYNIFSYSNIFENFAQVYEGDRTQIFLQASDYNTFSSNGLIAVGSPGTYTNLAEWQSDCNLDSDSATNALEYPGNFWNVAFLNPAVLRNPVIQACGANFGVSNNQFGFNIIGPTNMLWVVEACTNLANPVWTPLQTLTLTNGSFYFSEPFQTNTPGQFYRIRSP
jgi:hypothetical protein